MATTHDTVVVDATLDLIINGGSSEMSVISGSAEFGTFTALRDYTYPVYTGETTITPTASDQVLETAYTTVVEDITVLQIPYTEVANTAGGMTVSIG